MKKDYLEPQVEAVSLSRMAGPVCASTNSLSPLEERDDLGGMDWNYKS